ncbi:MULTISPECIES: hypothetical protein [Chryseobacterium]|uniref:hypothetical protein n=1 Tax=Chryseobacterium sp. R2A-55 TaxID=2744445 RepID=UPI001F2C33F8|nr:hypothetical protein [Chryseobacterium sp. R2A-55]
MAFLDHNGESEFPFNKDNVFNAMCEAIPKIDGMKIENADKLSGRILVKAGVSLYSWGENIPIQLTTISENLTKVSITSSPKTGIMFGGAFDMGKNRKNIERILQATSNVLVNRNQITENPKTENSQQTQFSQPQQPQNFSSSNYTQQNSNFNQSNTKKWYNKKWLVIILCIIFFPIGLYALWKSNVFSKGWKIGITAFIAFAFFYNLMDDKKSSNTSNISTTDKTTETSRQTVIETPKEKEWTKVYSFSGNGMKKSPTFELTGNEARIKYNYKADGGLGMGMFAVYVVDEGDDIMKTGGVPEVMSQAENEESESTIQKSAGKYYLNVNASGNWTVTVEELK